MHFIIPFLVGVASAAILNEGLDPKFTSPISMPIRLPQDKRDGSFPLNQQHVDTVANDVHGGKDSYATKEEYTEATSEYYTKTQYSVVSTKEYQTSYVTETYYSSQEYQPSITKPYIHPSTTRAYYTSTTTKSTYVPPSSFIPPPHPPLVYNTTSVPPPNSLVTPTNGPQVHNTTIVPPPLVPSTKTNPPVVPTTQSTTRPTKPGPTATESPTPTPVPISRGAKVAAPLVGIAAALVASFLML